MSVFGYWLASCALPEAQFYTSNLFSFSILAAIPIRLLSDFSNSHLPLLLKLVLVFPKF
jgi:hypothetical protein